MKRQSEKCMVETISGRRSHPRAPLSSQASICVGPVENTGLIVDISEGGAFVAIENPSSVSLNDGLRLRFSLPGSVALSVFAKVQWVREEAAGDKPKGIGVLFIGLGRTERQTIAKLVQQNEVQQSGPDVAVRVSRKYTVQITDDTLWIRLNGYLSAEECQGLCDIMGEQIDRLEGQILLTLLDATHFSACPEESLPFLRKCLAKLGGRGPSFSVMIGTGSVAMLQMRRLAREAGVADSIACFENENEALPFWQQIQKEVRESSP